MKSNTLQVTLEYYFSTLFSVLKGSHHGRTEA